MQRVEVLFNEAFLPRVAAEVMKYAQGAAGKMLACDRVVVVLPGRRAARRLVELLAEYAQAHRCLLVPPQVCTPQQFCLLVCEWCGVDGIATPMEQLAAWMRACEAEPALLQAVCGTEARRTPASGEQLFALARHFNTVYSALAGERLQCADAAERLPADTTAHARLLALGQLTEFVRAVLAERGLRTPYDAIEAALAVLEGDVALPVQPAEHILVAGVVDQFAQFAACVRALRARVTIMTYGPAGADWFDDTGALRWRDELTFEELDAYVERMVCADTAAAQAQAVVEWLRTAGSGHAVTDVAIGTPDAEVSRALRAALALEGVSAHDAVGTPFSESVLGVLLRALTELVEDQTWDAALRLVRHPVMEAYLRRRLGIAPLSAAAFAEQLAHVEEYLCDHLVQIVSAERPADGDAQVEAAVAQLTQLITDILARFTGNRRLSEWLDVLNECLEAWHSAIDDTALRDEEALRAWADLSASVAEARVQPPGDLTAPAALRQVLALASELVLAPPRTGPAIDLVGWLELALDDAPVVAVTGMNEGVLSENVVSDPFLPDGLREHLGLACNKRRFMRDRYILRTIVNTGKRFLLTTGRAASTGDPLRISRVLCDLSPPALADVLLRFYGHQALPEAAARAAAARDLSATDAAPLLVQPPKDDGIHLDVHYLQVTEFATYLACPYRFYLRRTVGEPPAPPGVELTPPQFGTLLHAVLAAFGQRGPRDATDPRPIAEFLHRELERQAAQIFGRARTLALDVQLAACHQRLETFAIIQAARAREGFEIIGTEVSQRFDFALDGMQICMRMDRLDRRGSELHVLDYKTGKVKRPEQHAQRRDAWVDLQLPLYWHGVMKNGAFSSLAVRVGYFILPGATAESAVTMADWQVADYDAALECARGVIAQVRAQNFTRTRDLRQCEDCVYCSLCQRG